MNSLLTLLINVIQIYIYIIFGQVILNWLIYFRVVNTGNEIVATIGNFLYRATEPVYSRIRRVIPTIGGLDVSPLILILGLWFLQNLLYEYWPR